VSVSNQMNRIIRIVIRKLILKNFILKLGEFDPGSERTLAACLTHASRTRKSFGMSKVAHG
jgi:hypothetical protein